MKMIPKHHDTQPPHLGGPIVTRKTSPARYRVEMLIAKNDRARAIIRDGEVIDELPRAWTPVVERIHSALFPRSGVRFDRWKDMHSHSEELFLGDGVVGFPDALYMRATPHLGGIWRLELFEDDDPTTTPAAMFSKREKNTFHIGKVNSDGQFVPSISPPIEVTADGLFLQTRLSAADLAKQVNALQRRLDGELQ
jgi:hypothetical protein